MKSISRIQAVSAWFVVVTLAIASAVVAGVALNTGNITLWFVAGLVPPAVLFRLWPSGPPATVGEVLYAVDTAKTSRLR